MVSIDSLIKKLRADYPQFTFTEGDIARWHHSNKTIYYTDDTSTLLHELAHACLNHTSYHRDIELLQIERDAWEYAVTYLSPRYDLPIDDVFIQDHLDTYRDWLHAKSTCPECTSTGVEVSPRHYKCLICNHSWRVNSAVDISLRRYSIQ